MNNTENSYRKDILQDIENDEKDDTFIEDLDISWMDIFFKGDEEYKIYYSEDISFIKIHYIYINMEGEIEKVKEEKLLLKTNGIIQKEELLNIIKSNLFSGKFKYSLMSILKFNINIEPQHLKNFLRNKKPNIGTPFLQPIKNIDSIKFDKSISMFHDINELIILFNIKNNKPSTYTKKQLLNLKNKKTKRKELK
jgi:hypothetical protein